MTHIITNGETTNGETKIDEPYIPSLDRIEDKLSYFLGKLVEHHVKKAVEAKLQTVVLVTDQLEAELDELKAKADVNLADERLEDLEAKTNDLVNYDSIIDIVNERLDERDSERDDAEDASAYVKIEDLESAVRDHIESYNLMDDDASRELIREVINNDVTISVDEINISIEA